MGQGIPSYLTPVSSYCGDMSSILSEEYDVTKFGVMRGTENMGLQVTVVTIRRLNRKRNGFTPTMFDYKHMLIMTFNTSDTVFIYVVGI